MTHSIGEMMAHVEELADQMRALLPEPVDGIESGLAAPETTVPVEPVADAPAL